MNADESADLVLDGDTIEVRVQGSLDAAGMQRLLAAFAELRARHGRVFVLAPGRGKQTNSEARKVLTAWFRSNPVPIEAAVYGGGALQRASIEMIQRAVQFVAPGKLILTAFKTLDEARAWIDERRKLPPPALPPR